MSPCREHPRSAAAGRYPSAGDSQLAGRASPGLVPDPSGLRAWRWWDGYQWTAHTSDPTTGATSRAPVYGIPAYRYAGQARTSPHEQFAAETARLLRLPARRSPGLGVGSWFIPVVNFWFPYQAIRDCLPPGDPGRKVVGRMWAFFIAGQVTNLATVGLALLGKPAAFAAVAVSLAVGLGFAVHGARAVQLIGDRHRSVL